MCGIAGFAGSPFDHGTNQARLGAMCDAIRHRGPDDEGRLVLPPGVGLGMRRLSIIDVAGGHQPIHNEDESVSVVFNGEIYNHHELRARLQREGHHFRTHSDTETLVHLYEADGDRMVSSLRGMFAFAIWDRRQDRLFVARDHIGIKPLYLWRAPWGVGFASELRSFLALPDFPREVNSTAIASYLSLGYVADPACIFSAAEKLPPGHAAAWSRADGLRIARYWTPVRDEAPVPDERELAEELRRVLSHSVRSHLESEVPLGAFLSGGIDSSTVVALMAEAMDRPVQTFSIGFDEQDFNEAPDAAIVARALRTRHTELILRPDADALVDDVIRGFDEPFADSSALPTYLVSALARRHVTVSLSGDGGDELFGGYTRYYDAMRQAEVSSPALRHTLTAGARLLPQATPGRNRLLDLGRSRRGRYASKVATALDPRDGGVASGEVAAHMTSLDDLLAPWFNQTAGRDYATQVTMVDMMTYLPGDILTKVDRMSMAVSLEARVPLLDVSVIEFAAALPSRVKLHNGSTKWILRQAIDGLVPRHVLDKPKQGFAVPLRRWFRNELRHRIDALLRPDSPIYAWVDPRATRRIVREHMVGRRDHMMQLWRLLMLDGWHRSLASGALARAFQPSDVLGEVVATSEAR
jgi:asparagine synthase (glutamine-hydrolysing)